jgi:PilZ domain-containing protein
MGTGVKWTEYPIARVCRFRETHQVSRGTVRRGVKRTGSSKLNPEPDGQADRRHSDRFPIEREVRYKILSKRSAEEAGDGKTVNISSSGVLFTSGQVLLPGRRLELSISWPAQLNNKCALKLVARGRIVRFEDGRAAMEIQQYEFRTQSSHPSAAGPQAVVN